MFNYNISPAFNLSKYLNNGAKKRGYLLAASDLLTQNIIIELRFFL